MSTTLTDDQRLLLNAAQQSYQILRNRLGCPSSWQIHIDQVKSTLHQLAMPPSALDFLHCESSKEVEAHISSAEVAAKRYALLFKARDYFYNAPNTTLSRSELVHNIRSLLAEGGWALAALDSTSRSSDADVEHNLQTLAASKPAYSPTTPGFSR
jgi:hypothetical protein